MFEDLGSDLHAAEADGHGLIVNETGLPDHIVQSYIEENAQILGVNAGTTFGTYANNTGSLLARSSWRVPCSVIEEIMLARELAERDDDVARTIGSLIAAAFSDGVLNTHPDETTVALYDELAKNAKLPHYLTEMYRELLIASSVTTVVPFTSESFQFTPDGSDRQRTRSVIAPLIGVLPAEQIRVINNDMFGTGTLAYKPSTATQEMWLQEFFAPSTTAPRKAEMRRQDPLLAALLVEKLPVEDDQPHMIPEVDDVALGTDLYRLNPRLVARSTFPKGAGRYPRPLLTRSFALLEAKRLLNLMDYALLQGGSNFLVVAKKGSDQIPAKNAEIANLRNVLRRATRTGVVIGDHRLSIEVITPDLKELLNPEKRRLLGRQISTGLLRLPEFSDAEAGAGEAVKADVELLQRVIATDRGIIQRHVQEHVYDAAAKRNNASFQTGAASLWFPKIVLQGTQMFTDMILKLNDRGAISRRTTVEAAGLSYGHEREQRRREKKQGDDRLMVPPQIPFSSPKMSGGPNDNGGGRPRGGSPANGAPGSQPSRSTKDPARPATTIRKVAGETVKAIEVGEDIVRIGELTYAILEQYQDTKTEGRLTNYELGALEWLATQEQWPEEPIAAGPNAVVPVNPDYDIENVRAVRLAPGVSLLVGRRTDDYALVARALVFRTPEFGTLEAQETALRWGFETSVPDEVAA